MKRSKLALFQSLISLLLCCSMLIGTTFAWFTDGVTSGNNTIAAGTLDIELEYRDADGNWNEVNERTEVLDKEALWEPGYTEVAYLKVTNAGNLALKYALGVGVISETGSINVAGEDFYLSDHIRFGVIESEKETTYATREEARSALSTSSLIIDGPVSTKNVLNEKDDVRYVTLVVYMPEDVGNAANYATGVTPPEINLGIELVATQAEYESDSFGSNYDAAATLAAFNFPEERIACSTSAGVESDKDNNSTSGVTLTDEQASAEIPAGVKLEEGTSVLTLEVTTMDESDANITLEANEAVRSLDVHVKGVAKDNTVPMAITIKKAAPEGLNMGNYKFYHVENGQTVEMTYVESNADFTAHNQFKYDPATGDIILYMATFSEIAMVADTENAWNGTVATAFAGGTGTEADPYIIANADQLVHMGDLVSNDNDNENYGAKHYKLVSDVNLGGEENTNKGIIFYPIGYHKVGGTIATVALDDAPEAIYEINEDSKVPGATMASEAGSVWYTYGGAFKGTFDGAGHTVANIYQNTWQLKGNYDGNYWNAAMGLFGYVYGGTVKNLTVSSFSSDGEFTPTGVIAAYAAGNSSFENIAIVGCNPRVYNTGNGGIIGIAGDTREANDDHIVLKNITVDNSNKISALWGSWDVACGGLVGMYRGNVDGSGNATGDTISFDNCHVSAIIDVYNDVCANYQYYAYRYSGMIIGSVRHNTTNADGKTIPNMTGISATGCTANFGTWNDYYYCEIIDNTTASYTHDYQMSRLTEIKAIDGTTITYLDGTTGTVPVSGRANYVIVDYTKGHGTENATCYHFKDGAVWTHDMGGIQTGIDENGDGQDDLKEDKQHIYLEFNNLFTGYGWGVSSMGINNWNGINALGVGIGTQNNSVEKFETKFTGDFLYRVGNAEGSTVSLGTLFETKGDAKINSSGVYVTIDKVDENSNVSGTFKANTSDWTKGTIQFTGTGIVKLTIQDYDYCMPTVLYLEVVDAVNATSATSATSNNVVLLNDCGFSSLEVSGGYTLYGNGFTMTCGSDSYAIDRTYSFVELKGGTLDNVRIVTPNFSHAIMYEKNKTEGGNPSNTDSSGRTRYYNIRSAVLVTATSKIANSYISGGRAAVYATAGTLTLENSTIYGGAVANIQAEVSSNLVLNNMTLIQKPIKANVNDTSKTVMGLSVVNMCDTAGIGANISLQGYLHQYAWANKDYAKYVPSDAQDVVDEVLAKSEFVHQITYEDGVKRDSVNLGFVNMPDGTNKTQNTNITEDSDKRTDGKPYEWTTVKVVANIYTYKNTNGTDDTVGNEPSSDGSVQGNVLPTVAYNDINDARVFTTSYDASTGQWKATLKVDVDAGAYDFSFDKLLVQKYGKSLDYAVTEGKNQVDKSKAINLSGAEEHVYTLTITDDQIYDQSGKLTGKTETVTYVFELLATKTSLPAPTWTSQTLNGTPYIVVDSKGGDWNCAVPVLDGLKVKYWSKKQNKEDELDLAEVVSAAGLSKGLQNDNNNTITIKVADEYTLQITTTGFKTNDNGKPVVVNGKLYFTVSSSSNYVSTKTTDRTISINYVFTDANNSDPVTLSTSRNVAYADYKSKQYKYSDFCSGTLTEASSCVTGDTQVTLANGTKKCIDQVTYADRLLAWDFFKGEFTAVSPAIIFDHGYDNNTVIELKFSDGTTVKAVTLHQFFDADQNKLVTIDAESVADYVGHKFAKKNGNGYKMVKLVDYTVSQQYIDAWGIISAEHYNIFVEDMLSTDFMHEDYPLFNYFEVGKNMTFDQQKMKADIAKYGLYTYEDFAEYLTPEQFAAFNVQYFKIPVGKGEYTYDGIIDLIQEYLNN